MKKLFSILLLHAVAIVIANAQVTQTNNTPPFGQGPFIGWNTLGGSIGLDIKTELAQPISFYTNAGAGGFANLRMEITTGLGGNGLGALNSHIITKVNINRGNFFQPITFPVAMFNIGEDQLTNPSAGSRAWMDVGTYYTEVADPTKKAASFETAFSVA